jgi:hypothetical protein
MFGLVIYYGRQFGLYPSESLEAKEKQLKEVEADVAALSRR